MISLDQILWGLRGKALLAGVALEGPQEPKSVPPVFHRPEIGQKDFQLCPDGILVILVPSIMALGLWIHE